ncbi:MAG: hypothetical protein ACREAN_02510 [Nitrosopumilaceae archaeon]
MHDSEPDTFPQKNTREQFCELLEKIGVKAEPKQIDAEEVEKGEYYSKHRTFSHGMITNHGCVEIRGTNIDIVQLIQKG